MCWIGVLWPQLMSSREIPKPRQSGLAHWDSASNAPNRSLGHVPAPGHFARRSAPPTSCFRRRGRAHFWPSAFSDLTVNDSSSWMKVIIILGRRRTVTFVLSRRISPCIDLRLTNQFPRVSPSGPSFSAWPCYSPVVPPQCRDKTQQRISKRLQQTRSPARRIPYGSSRPNNWKKVGSPCSTAPLCLAGK